MYSSANNDIESLEDKLYDIERRIRFRNEKVETGDFNAKSDKRKETVTEWTAANDFIIANQGEAPTLQVLLVNP